ncbi:MAG: aminopeptidase P family protein [Microbacteriaceae bacterium]
MSNEDQKPTDAPLEERGTYRAQRPHGEEFLKYISANWAERDNTLPARAEVAGFAKTRRAKVAEKFAGKVILIEAGSAKTRSNDTEYRFRAHAAFTHLTGWGSATVPDSVLVIDTRHNSETLYFRETAGRDSEEFFANAAIGEFWVGARPTLAQVSALLGITTKSLSELDDFRASLHDSDVISLESEALAEFVSEMRFVKDSYEIAEMRKAVAASAQGFEEVVRNLDKAIGHHRGERVVEGAFFTQARLLGNDLGYETIAASGSHACTLHWIINDGPVKSGDLLLLDAGVEVDSLYTADITRTLPVNGKFTDVQRKVYEAVLKAADAVFAVAKPGLKFRDLHAEAMRVIAETVSDWGLIEISAEESLHPDKQLHRRWMVHGTSHHLGIDVHDCAQARRELYLEQELKPGMIFTIEPGLYFQPDDLMVPEELRGIGVRIEDDVLVTETGVENLSAALPRKVDEIEAWMASLS